MADWNSVNIGVWIPRYPAVFWRPVYQGIRARAAQYAAEGIPIHLMMQYIASEQEQELSENFIEWFETKQPQGLIAYSKGRSSFLRQYASRASITVLGARNSDLFDVCSFVGTDPDAEGDLAAELLLRHMPKVRNVAILWPAHDYYDYTSQGRRYGFCNRLVDHGPVPAVYDLHVDFHSKLSSAMIARELSRRYQEYKQNLDCIYVTNDMVGIACLAVAKARRSSHEGEWNPLSKTICIGHERPKNAQQYIEAGILGGCLTQDAYRYGFHAVEQTVERCLGRRKGRAWEFIAPKVEDFYSSASQSNKNEP